MSKQYIESLQSRFSAYLVVAVTNQRIRYIKRKKRQRLWENSLPDIDLKKYRDFNEQYHEYQTEQTAFVLEDWERFYEFMELLESKKLKKLLGKLKEHERRILFARIFGELTFEEMGEKFGMKPKQAEMAFYYILRKLRKELEGDREDEF